MSRRQDGQALVGALVVTTLAFLMAGAVAVGASALLSQEGNPQNASSHDLAAQDALAAAVAAVAGGSSTCSQSSSTLATIVSQAQCVRVDGIPSGPFTPWDLNSSQQLNLVGLPAWSSNCDWLDISRYRSKSTTSNNHVRIWFTASGSASAWVDQTSGCKKSKNPVCTDNPPSNSVTQVLLDCQLDDDPSFYLHVNNPSQSPVLVRLAQGDGSGGSIYVLAASTGLAGGPAYEEADLWVSQDGSIAKLLFEGTL